MAGAGSPRYGGAGGLGPQVQEADTVLAVRPARNRVRLLRPAVLGDTDGRQDCTESILTTTRFPALQRGSPTGLIVLVSCVDGMDQVPIPKDCSSYRRDGDEMGEFRSPALAET